MSNYKPKLIYKSEKPYEGDINDLIEKSSKKDEMKVSRKEMIEEHKKLVDVLESPSHKDDKKEAKKQAKELKEYEDEEIEKGGVGSGIRGHKKIIDNSSKTTKKQHQTETDDAHGKDIPKHIQREMSEALKNVKEKPHNGKYGFFKPQK